MKSCWANSLRVKSFCKEGCMFSIITYVSIRACLDIKRKRIPFKEVTILEKAKRGILILRFVDTKWESFSRVLFSQKKCQLPRTEVENEQ